MNTARIYEYFANLIISFIDFHWSVYTSNFVDLGSNQILVFKISCITTSSFSAVQAGCVGASKHQRDYDSPGIPTRITENELHIVPPSTRYNYIFAWILATLLIMVGSVATIFNLSLLASIQ